MTGDDYKGGIRSFRSRYPDYFGKPARIRRNGRVLYDLTLYEVKAPQESRYAWDYLKPVRTLSGTEAFGAEEPGDCVPAQ